MIRMKMFSLINMIISKLTLFVFVVIVTSGCFSSPRLWQPSDHTQNHILKTSFSGSIAVSIAKRSNVTVRMSIFDSISNRFYKGSFALALDSQMILPGGEDSVITYERKYIASCGDGRDVFTHKLILSKENSQYKPESSVYINYGCEYWGERMIINQIKSTDSSIIVYGFMSDKSKEYPLWIEVLPVH